MNGSKYIEEMIYMKDEVPEISEVTEFYNGCNVLITGASGFLGKLLIEKLLRTCSVNNVFALMRPKKGKTPHERLMKIFEDPLYDRLYRQEPNFMKRIILIEGDAGEDDLGLCSSDREFLKENTHIVFHGAATVRFDESLRKVIHTNVRGIKLMLDLAREMPNLKAFVHVSTAYAHCPQKNIKEEFYPLPMALEKIFNTVEMFDDDTLKLITPKIIGQWPNTYAFSKAVGEEVIRKYGFQLPVCIVRPSIVMSTNKDPICGWTDNVYGTMGVTLGVFLCVLRVFHLDSKIVTDMIPADYVINNIIVAAWDTAKMWNLTKRNGFEIVPKTNTQIEPVIYNCVSSVQNPLSWDYYIGTNKIEGRKVPSMRIFWSDIFFLTKRRWLYNILVFLLHTVPAALVDALLVISGKKPKLSKIYQKIHKFSDVIGYFSSQQWTFDNSNVMKLWDRTSHVDKEKFDFNIGNLDWNEYLMYHMGGLRVYMIKDPMDTLWKAKIRYVKLIVAHYILVAGLFLFLVWIVCSIFGF